MSTGATEHERIHHGFRIDQIITPQQIIDDLLPGESICSIGYQSSWVDSWYTKQSDGRFKYLYNFQWVKGRDDIGSFCETSDLLSFWPSGGMTYLGRRAVVNGTAVWLDGPPPDLDNLDPVPFADLEPDRLYRHYAAAGRDSGLFLDWLAGQTTEPDKVQALAQCPSCTGWRDEDTLWEVNDGNVCGTCKDRFYNECRRCSALHQQVVGVADGIVCYSCRDRYYVWCEECDAHVDSETDNHCHGGGCVSPALGFSVRNDGHGMLPADTRAQVTLAQGVISEQGIEEIWHSVYYWGNGFEDIDREERAQMRVAAMEVRTLDPKWQAKDGNFTKRLSRTVYNKHKVKLPSELLSQIGNIARDHSGGSEYAIEVTRDLNLAPEEFAHEDSCWWGSYGSSRCALKSNGGFGLRTFAGPYDRVQGRAWVLPLKRHDKRSKRNLEPTFNTESPDAMVIFNGYGDLSGYIAARIMAHMYGWTYRKIDFYARPMYVNGEQGYLVAPEDIASKFTDGGLSLELDPHSNLFDDEQNTITASQCEAKKDGAAA